MAEWFRRGPPQQPAVCQAGIGAPLWGILSRYLIRKEKLAHYECASSSLRNTATAPRARSLADPVYRR